MLVAGAKRHHGRDVVHAKVSGKRSLLIRERVQYHAVGPHHDPVEHRRSLVDFDVAEVSRGKRRRGPGRDERHTAFLVDAPCREALLR